MNKKRGKAILEVYEELRILLEEERESLENQEEYFGNTDKWQNSKTILCDAEGSLEELESALQEWGIL